MGILDQTTQPQPSAGVSASGSPDMAQPEPPATDGANAVAIDTKPFVAEVEKNVPPDKMKIFKTMVLKGDAQMFAKGTHKLTLEQLNGPGEMGQKLGEGVVALMYILFEKSNKTLPPDMLEPAGTVLLCHAFDFLQESGDPEATKETFGEAVDTFRLGIHNALGVTEEQFNKAMQEQQGKTAPEPPSSEQPGILGVQP